MHWGATSQDMIDTGTGAAARRGRRHSGVAGTCAAEAARPRSRGATRPRPWRAAPGCSRPRPPRLVSRPPAGSRRSRARTSAWPRRWRRRCVCSSAARQARWRRLGAAGPAVADALGRASRPARARDALARERTGWSRVACALGIACGSLGKIGRDIALLAQTEVGEAWSRPSRARRVVLDAAQAQSGGVGRGGRGGGAARRAWWRRCCPRCRRSTNAGLAAGRRSGTRCRALVNLTERSSRAMAHALAHLVVDEARMRTNLDWREAWRAGRGS